MKERRDHRRLSMRLPLRVQGIDNHGQVVNLISMTENVSGGGAYFFHSDLLDVGMNVDVFLSVTYDTMNIYPPKILTSRASVVRVETDTGRTGTAVKKIVL